MRKLKIQNIHQRGIFVMHILQTQCVLKKNKNNLEREKRNTKNIKTSLCERGKKIYKKNKRENTKKAMACNSAVAIIHAFFFIAFCILSFLSFVSTLGSFQCLCLLLYVLENAQHKTLSNVMLHHHQMHPFWSILFLCLFFSGRFSLYIFLKRSQKWDSYTIHAQKALFLYTQSVNLHWRRSV